MMQSRTLDEEQHGLTPTHRAWKEKVADENPYIATSAMTNIMTMAPTLSFMRAQFSRLIPCCHPLSVFKEVTVDSSLVQQDNDLFLIVSNMNHVAMSTDLVDSLMSWYPGMKARWPYLRVYRSVDITKELASWKMEEKKKAQRKKDHEAYLVSVRPKPFSYDDEYEDDVC